MRLTNPEKKQAQHLQKKGLFFAKKNSQKKIQVQNYIVPKPALAKDLSKVPPQKPPVKTPSPSGKHQAKEASNASFVKKAEARKNHRLQEECLLLKAWQQKKQATKSTSSGSNNQ